MAVEREFVSQKLREFLVQEHITETLDKVGHSHTKVQRTPLGEKIIIFASRPGLVVGRKGQNIKKLTGDLKKKFNLENPQIEISEVTDENLDAQIVAEKIAAALERMGIQKFKGVGHKAMTDTLGAGGIGIEILISGKIPGARAKTWRFYQGYLKKSGDLAVEGVRTAYSTAQLKTGSVGIQVRIMPGDLRLPDHVELRETPLAEIQEIVEQPKKERKKKTDKQPKQEKKEVLKEEKKEDKKEEKKEEKIHAGAADKE